LAITIKIAESNGAGPAKTVYVPTSPATNQWAYKSKDTSGVAVAGEEVARENLRSYPKWFQLEASGTGTSVNGIVAWFSDQDLSLFGTSAQITASKQEIAAYSQAVNNNDTTDATAPISYATGIDLTPAGGIVAFTGYSKYLRHQIELGADATAGVYTNKLKLNIYAVVVN
jgi:hypothetical protein